MAPDFDPSSLPRKRVGAGVLLRDQRGAVLIVEPTYKDLWEIPGGLVEEGESPREAAARECREELGVDLTIGALLCVHYSEGVRTPGDGVMFVFDAGSTERSAESYDLPPDELRSARFVPADDLGSYLVPLMVVRMTAAITATRTGGTVYLER